MSMFRKLFSCFVLFVIFVCGINIVYSSQVDVTKVERDSSGNFKLETKDGTLTVSKYSVINHRFKNQGFLEAKNQKGEAVNIVPNFI